MRHTYAYLGCFFLLFAGCDSEPSSGDAEEEGGESEQERADREAKQAADAEEAQRIADEEAAEEAIRVAHVEDFCTNLSRLHCLNELHCHPEMTDDHLANCVRRRLPTCQGRMANRDWHDGGAEACFTAGEVFNCETSLEEFFIAECGGVLGDGAADTDEECEADVACKEGHFCEKSEKSSCYGSCVELVQEGMDCTGAQCVSGLSCRSSLDDEGFDIRTCELPETERPEEMETETEDIAPPCLYHEFLTDDDECAALGLPGNPCGGTNDVGCTASATCEGSGSTGTCTSIPSDLGRSCTDQAHCSGNLECWSDYEGNNGKCKLGARTCYRDHPLMLY